MNSQLESNMFLIILANLEETAQKISCQPLDLPSEISLSDDDIWSSLISGVLQPGHPPIDTNE